MWSVVEKTALAEAEVEYHDHTSTHDLGALSPDRGQPARPGRCGRGHLDHDPLDHPRQPRGRLWRRHRLSADRGRRGRRRVPGAGGRAAGGRGRAAGRGRRHRRHPQPQDAGRVRRRGARRQHRPPSARRPCRWLRFRRAAAGRRLRHHRAGHRPCPRRPEPWRGRFRAGCAPRPRGAGHGGRGRHLHRSGSRLRGPARVQGGRAGDRGPDRAWRPARARHAGPQLPAFLALQGALDLPRHRAVVHPDGRRRSPARQGAGRHRRDPLRPRPAARTACAR